jgi:branched-chain amino acid transport system ATP-binding protein
VALRYADRATVLENGLAALEGPAAELRRRDDIKALYLGRAARRDGAAETKRERPAA